MFYSRYDGCATKVQNDKEEDKEKRKTREETQKSGIVEETIKKKKRLEDDVSEDVTLKPKDKSLCRYGRKETTQSLYCC